MAEEVSERVARLLNIESVMERLGVGRSTVFGLFGSGELRSVKVGRRRLVPESAIIDFIDSLQFTGGADACGAPPGDSPQPDPAEVRAPSRQSVVDERIAELGGGGR